MAEFKEISPNASAGAKLSNWFENRLPTAFDAYRVHMSEYYAPKNFNFWYIFGSLAMLVLVIQIVTGIFLVMHYKPDAALAFASVEYIMRDVPWGWLIRYMHSTGASAFFVVVYLHMFRGLIYGSYRKPRELVWIFGCAIFLCLMAEAFMGYLLPWGQMSYWGAQVIVNLFAAIPFVGPDLALLIRGDFVVGDATLNRFFSFHVIAVPLVLLGLVVAHLMALHDVGSNNPDGVEIKGPNAPRDAAGHPLDGVPFHPYYTVHDIFGVSVFLIVFSAIIFFAPEFGGYFLEYNNFIPADPFKTPLHIAPVWYFTPFYSMLRAVTGEMATLLALIVLAAVYYGSARLPSVFKAVLWVVGLAIAVSLGVLPGLANWFGFLAPLVNGLLTAIPFLGGIDAKFWGVVAMGGGVVILFFLPWLDNCAVKSIRYRPDWHKYLYAVFVLNFVILAYLGTQAPSAVGERVSQIGTLFYFGFFLLMPWWSRIGEVKPVPDRVNFVAH
ncbi:MAG: cytochrome bc complex cytochrome b subunit [Burkholderiales bacterium]|jgi:ubiquinol-cytochrome c reductase cytochrome b subunit|nr:cytochrome bc complex cytochrome b subunit [Burkholderiales bacterium]